MKSNFYGSRIKAGRKRLKLSVDEFAARLGVSRATQMNYESGRTLPSVAYVDQCAHVGIDPFDLLEAGSELPTKSNSGDSDAMAVEIFRLLDGSANSLDSPAGRAYLFQALLRLVRRAARVDANIGQS